MRCFLYPYRYGFNGKEKDDETYGDGDEYDYGMRIYDSRLGRFMSVDPLTKDYPWYAPYQFSGNNPIENMDRDGEEEEKATTKNPESDKDDKTEKDGSSKEATNLPAKIRLDYSLSLTKRSDLLSGNTSPNTQIWPLPGQSQTYYTTPMHRAFRRKHNDWSEPNFGFTALYRISNSKTSVGVMEYKEKMSTFADGFRYEAGGPVMVVGSQTFNIFSKSFHKKEMNLGLSTEIIGGVGLYNADPKFDTPNNYPNVTPKVLDKGIFGNSRIFMGTSQALILRVNCTFTYKRFSFYAYGAMSGTHVSTKDINTTIGIEPGGKFDSIGEKGGFGIGYSF